MTFHRSTLPLVATIALLFAVVTDLFPQAQQRGTVERVKVRGRGLEGNLSGDSPDRDVSIYLPPTYEDDSDRRYPVVYMLHGFTDSDAQWMGFKPHWINLAEVTNKALAGAATRELIVVMPNAFTPFQGSMYSNSVTTGNWENFVAEELVKYVDSHYRTIPERAARGLAGHSMGGYGTLRIGMKHPEVFSSLYALSPCCLAPRVSSGQGGERMAKAEAVRSVAEIENADFGTKATLASAAAWSPNPDKPPFFLDLPFQDGEFQPLVAAKWAANAPLAMVDQYITNLRRFEAIAFDAGDKDRGIAASIKVLDETLRRYGISHTFEIYSGNHTNRVGERIEIKMLPFFAKHLSFDQTRR